MAFIRSRNILCSLFLALCLYALPAESRLIQSFGNCPELNNYFVNKLVPLVGPYGLSSSSAYANTRAPQHVPSDPGTPGGPAGLPLYRPFREPKHIAFSNITSGIDDEVSASANGGPVAGKDFSATNVQVKGVDEPDIIKTDGKRVFTLSGQIFSVVEVLNKGASGKRVGKLRLPTYPNEMLFQGDWVLALGPDSNYKRPVYQRFRKDPSYGEPATVVYQIKITRGMPRLVSTLHLEGTYIKSREVDGVARLVLKFNPLNSLWLYYSNGRVPTAQIEKWNREIIQYSRPGNWLPTYRLHYNGRVQKGVYATCADVYYSPNKFAGFNLLTVVTLPVDGLLSPTSSASVMSNANNVYATKKTMYVSTSEIQYDSSGGNSNWGSDYQTAIHKFNLTNSGATYVASGSVTGSVINQFAMHEYRGVFFVATTEGATWWSNRDTSKSKVTAFKPDKKTRMLRKIGEVGNLGIGERIFAVRFRGGTGFVVTFREIDPLYIIDLADPTNLRVTGELKIPGYSSYLHYVGPGRILGVGQEATLQGRPTGAKVSLFDVSDKSNPVELSAWSLKGSYTNAEWDHRAFLYWWRERVAVMPVNVYSAKESFTGAIVLDISESKITVRGRVSHKIKNKSWIPSIKRNTIIGKVNLWSMSSDILQVNNIKKLNKVSAQVSISG